MSKRVLWIVGALLAVFGLAGFVYSWKFSPQISNRDVTAAAPVIIGLPASTEDAASGYQRVTGPQTLVFPKDHGPHPDYLTEWWYYTGNLETAEGRHFGYQLTFFRRAIAPPDQRSPRDSDWAASQVYMAHFTLTDVAAGQFHADERFERGALGLAGATGDPLYSVWLRDWSVKQTQEHTFHLSAQQDDLAIELDLVDEKGIVLQGDQGYSQKGPQPGNASLYYSQTRLNSTGTVAVNGQTYAVSGLSWMDREISTSALSEGQVGWDWFALQLEDGSELMAFILRRSDGSVDAYSSGAWISPDGQIHALKRDDFSITSDATWKSPHSGAVYPARWTISVPSQQVNLQVEPYLADQELNVSFTYWEGAVRVQGEHAGQTVSGSGYVELTGYLQSMQGQF